MRVGCFGCLTGLLALVALVTTVGGAGWVAWRTLRDPGFEAVGFTQADAARAQKKLLAIIGRSKASPEAATVSLTAREVDALIAPRLADLVALPLRDVQAVPVAGALAVQARMPLGAMLGEPPFSRLVAMLPAAALARPVWIEVRARALVERADEPRRRKFLRFEPTYLSLGRQRLPALFYRLLLPPSAMAPLRSPLPAMVEDVTIEPGRVVIRATS